MKLARLSWIAFVLMSVYTHAEPPAPHQPGVPFISDVEETALKHPKPEYPRVLRARHITGAGLFEVAVDAPSGQVIDVSVVRSTGSKALDRCAVEALKRWIFRPNTVTRAKIPIAFTLKQH